MATELTVFAHEDEPIQKAIKARQAVMTLRSWYAEPLFRMAKGDIQYDSEWASALAKSLKAELDTIDRGMWPEDTGYENYPDLSGALPEWWLDTEGTEKAETAYVTAVVEMADAAGKGLDSLRSAVGKLGNSCKQCHDSYLVE